MPGDENTDVVDKLEQAQDHQDRAEDLIDEALEEATAVVDDRLPFAAEYDAEHISALPAVRVHVHPTSLLDGDGDETASAEITGPMTVTFSGATLTDRERVRHMKHLIDEIEDEYTEGAPKREVFAQAVQAGIPRDKAEHEIMKLRQKGDVYEPATDRLRTV